MLQYGKRSVKVAVFFALAVICLLSSVCISGATLAYTVNYRGKVIGVVRNKEEFKGAVKIVEKSVNGENIAEMLNEPKYETSLAPQNSIVYKEELSKNIIDNTDEIVSATEISVDGKRIAVVCGNEIENFLNKKLNAYNIDGAECISKFKENIVFTDGLYLLKDIDNVESVKTALSFVTVETTVNTVTESEIEYKTVTKTSSEYAKGESVVTVNGRNGKRAVKESIKYVNGVEVFRETVSDEIVLQPTDKVIVKGTAPTVISQEEQQDISKSGFVFPLPKGVWQVSAYFGDGRNHKGVDLRAPKGTAIMAVASGEVVYSGWKSDYGYCIEIDHGNGLHTRYGHASSLIAKRGTFVSAGEVVALVGATGDAYGNHLHFEVIRGGVRYNPAPYIGL